MDVSSEYVKMCEGAREIQDIWRPEQGDYVCDEPHASRRWTMVGERGWTKCAHDAWLPRQDQLQEMVKRASLPWMLRDASDFAFDHDVTFGPTFIFGSMEQLWLAFVMYQKFGKSWNGETWE